MIDICVPPHHLGPAGMLVFYSFSADDVGPGAVRGGVEVQPRGEPVARLGVELHLVMPGVEQAEEIGRVRVEFAGVEQLHVALDRRRAHGAAQG